MENTAHQLEQNSDVVFAVMGATGTGKSTFIKILTGDENILIGHKQQSETSDIQTSRYIDQASGRSVMLIDTPGFDDSREGVTDTDILQKIVEYLEPEKGERRMVNGIIYMHRISDPRVGGVSRKNLRMFYSLCGEKSLANVRIVTTNWGRVSEEEGTHRETDLRNGAFKALVDAGAQMRRHANTLESARQIMAELIPLPKVTTKIQEEVREGKKLVDTEAGQVLTAEMREMQKRHEKEMADLKKEMELAVQTKDHELRAELAKEHKALEDKIAKVEADRAKLERTLEEERREQARLRKHEADQIAQLMRQLADERSRMQAQMQAHGAHHAENANRGRNLERRLAQANRRVRQLESRNAGLGCLIC